MRFSTIIAGSLLTTGIALSACQSENIEIPKSELYTREFIKEFGIADPNHDWNNASQGTVTVVTSSPTHVEVLAEIKGKRYIFADYRKVTGTETINFTIPKGINNIIVTLNGREVPTTLGATVNGGRTGASRTGHYGDSDPVVTISRTEEKDWLVLTAHDTKLYSKRMPEGSYNVENRGVTSDFIFQSEGDFIVYPLYWDTSQTPTFGVYYYDSEKKDIVHVDVYTADKTATDSADDNTILVKRSPNINSFNTKNGQTANKNPNGETVSINDELRQKIKSIVDKAFNDAKAEGVELQPGNGNYKYETFDCPNKIDGILTKACNELLSEIGVTDFLVHEWRFWSEGELDIRYSWNYPYKDKSDLKGVGGTQGNNNSAILEPSICEVVISKGIKIHITPGTLFGAYIKTSQGYFYSNRERNEYPQLDAEKNIIEGKNASHASTWTGDKYGWTMLGFEDWPSLKSDGAIDTGADFDLNDFVFMLAGANPDVIPEGNVEKPEPEKYNYIIAAEDLGGTCDWDFNDLVIGVNVVSKNYVEAEDGVEGSTPSLPYKEVTVTPLASGGTLPIYLMYTGKVSTSQSDYNASVQNYLIGREFHAWLSNAQDAPLTPINVGANASTTGEPITFHIPDENYTLAMHDKYSASDDGTNNMGGFWVLVINQNDTPYTPAITDGKGLTQITDIPEGKGITRIEAPKPDLNIGSIAPQMLCIDHEWFWPREGKKIHLAYPASSGPGFEGWVNDPGVQGTWYGEGKYVESLVTKRPL